MSVHKCPSCEDFPCTCEDRFDIPGKHGSDISHDIDWRVQAKKAEAQRDALAAALEDLTNSMAVEFEDERLRYVVVQVSRTAYYAALAIDPSAILAARLAEERKAGALNELNLWADEGDLDEAVVTRMRRRAAQIERGEEKP